MRRAPFKFVLFGALTASAFGTAMADDAPQQKRLDLQERCAAQAKKEFIAEGHSENRKDKLEGYESHYSVSLERCLLRMESTDSKGTTKVLVDSFERRVFAMYVWFSKPDKKFWEVPPFQCELDPIGEPKRICTTDEEYEAFVQKMMDN